MCSFFFREAPKYEPKPDLYNFLQQGNQPVYIGFGSIVIDDRAELTKTVLAAVKATGVRAIVSKGWSNLGAESEDAPNVLFLDDCPHEWLFQHVSAVIHHGGAGTTAYGLLNSKSTAIVPFFGESVRSLLFNLPLLINIVNLSGVRWWPQLEQGQTRFLSNS